LATSVPIDGRAVSVVIGAAQKDGSVSVPINPGPIRPTNKPQRKRAYSYVSGQ
jgi:hypothetical protein